jgi:hypothetical protein
MPTNPKQSRKLERFTMLEPKEPNNLTDEQKKWPVAEGTHLERFTMLEPKEPNNLTDEQKKWPVVEGRGVAPEVGASDLATIRGLIDRLGAARLQQIVGALTAGGTAETR